MKASYKFLLTVLAAGIFSASAQQHPELNFAYRSVAAPNPVTVNPGGTLQFPTATATSPTEVTFIITNRSSTVVRVVRSNLSGSGFSGSALGNVTLAALESTTLTLRFQPSGTGAALGELGLMLDVAGRQSTVLFFLSGNASTPDVVLSYILNPGGNQLPLSSGAALRFQPATVGEMPTATLVLTNRGAGRATINSISASGEAFRLSGLPLLPFALAAEREVRFTVTFVPTERTQYAETLRVDIDGTPVNVSLQGQGVAPVFSFAVISSSATTEVPPGTGVPMPDTPVGQTAIVRIRVRNVGTSAGRIAAIAVTGTGYQLGDAPALPLTIAPGGTIDLVVNFTPREPGAQPGRLRLDATSIELAGTGVGARLQHSVISSSGTVVLPNNGTYNFPNTSVGARATADIAIENTGNAPAVINSIAVTGSGFSSTREVPLPLRLAPGESAMVPVAFAPESTGALSGALQVDDQRFTLRGVATAPAPIPAVVLSAAESAQALEQPAVGLRLAEPYPLPLTGRLTLAFTSESFADDPAIQFSSGGRTVDFRIPANSTEAVFSDGSRQIQFQSGTVAGSIGFSASFAVASVNVTPNPQPVRSVQVMQSEPRLTGVQISTRTATTFDLAITGYATARSITQLNFQFAAAPGGSLQTSTLTSNVEGAFSSWYSNASSRTFGSQFVATIRVNAVGDLNGLQSVTVTASNNRGVSAPVTVNLR